MRCPTCYFLRYLYICRWETASKKIFWSGSGFLLALRQLQKRGFLTLLHGRNIIWPFSTHGSSSKRQNRLLNTCFSFTEISLDFALLNFPRTFSGLYLSKTYLVPLLYTLTWHYIRSENNGSPFRFKADFLLVGLQYLGHALLYLKKLSRECFLIASKLVPDVSGIDILRVKRTDV